MLTHPYLKPLRIIRYHPRLSVAAVLGVIVALALPHSLRLSTRLLIGWDVGAVFYLAAAFLLAQDFDLKRIQLRADQYDEGGLLISGSDRRGGGRESRRYRGRARRGASKCKR